MLKKLVFNFIVALFFSGVICAQPLLFFSSSSNDVLSNYQHLSSKQLLDTANHYFRHNNVERALIFYSLLINSTPKNTDTEHQKRIIAAYNRSGILYYQMDDYLTAHDFFIKALLLCEKTEDTPCEFGIYVNIGNVYSAIKNYDMAELFYLKALNTHLSDSAHIVAILNNLGTVKTYQEDLDSALYFFREAQRVSKLYNEALAYSAEINLGFLFQKQQQFDSAFHYARSALARSIKNNNKIAEALVLQNLSKLFFETKKIDSAQIYAHLSNEIAKEHSFLKTVAENYLTLSDIEEIKGNKTKALEYFKIHTRLNDSIFNIEKFSSINQLQRLYEVTKTNQQIEELAIEKRIKERTIYLQKIVLAVLLLACCILLFAYFQKRRLDTAHQVLFEKSVETLVTQESLSKTYQRKYQKNALEHEAQEELLNRILAIMEDTSVICDTEFSIGTLTELVQSNYTYVSQVINTALKKNFRSFLNSYRIREAQRLFSEPDATKYTIESVALQVGFKSRNAFRDAFKEITGVTPNFYLKSMQKVNFEGSL